MLVVGDLMLDVLLLPELQREEQYGGMLVRSGGSAANTAAWMAYLGTDVTFVGCVGDDGVGTMLCSELRAEGVEVHARVISVMETGCVAVNLDQDGERMMRSARGANVRLDPDDIARAANDDVQCVHVTGYAMLSEAGYSVLEVAAKVAKRAGAVLSFDPSSVGAIQALGRERLLDAIAHCGVGILLPNGVEALTLSAEADMTRAAQSLGEVVPTVALKHGASGAICVSDGVTRSVLTEPVRPVDATGAGDAFNAGVLVASQRGDGLEDACRFANTLARKAIVSYGGRPAHAIRGVGQA